jgi:Pyruvate/2-oxoacid:ferredoxin oxidoreductase delta subunit
MVLPVCLRGCRSFVWLFEHMLLLVRCIGFAWFVQGECIFSNGEVGMCSFVGPCRPYIPYSSQGDYRHRRHIGHHSIFPFGGIDLSSGYWRIRHTSVWDSSNFLVCPYRSQFLHWAICILCWKSCCSEQVLARQKNVERVSLVLYCLMFQIFVTVCPSFSISSLISSGLME